MQEISLINYWLTINDSASRVSLLRGLGYQFKLANISHRSDNHVFDNTANVLVGRFHHANFQKALEVTQTNLKKDFTLDHFTIDAQLQF